LQVLRSDIETLPSTHHLTDLRFTDLPLSAGLQQGIAEAGFAQCTPIQSKTLPLALDGQDVAGQAQTGTGKTAAFLLALFHRLEHNPPLVTESGPPAPRALIMAPTRELAVP
jgi:ATP-dependent RNA helicase RhlB